MDQDKCKVYGCNQPLSPKSTYRCEKHRLAKNTNANKHRTLRLSRTLCMECEEPLSPLSKVFCEAHRVRRSLAARKSESKVVAKAQGILGGSCRRAHTGECNGPLEFDHINNDGFMNKRRDHTGSGRAREILKMTHPEEKWQLLCEFHNQTKHYWEPLELRAQIAELQDQLSRVRHPEWGFSL